MTEELAQFVFRGRLIRGGGPFGFATEFATLAPDDSIVRLRYDCADGAFRCDVFSDFDWAFPDLRNLVLGRAIEIVAAASVFAARYFDIEITEMENGGTAKSSTHPSMCPAWMQGSGPSR